MATSRPGKASFRHGLDRFEVLRDALFVLGHGGNGVDVFGGGGTTGSTLHALCIGERGR